MDVPSGRSSHGPRAQLTCEMCKRRKVKCDKLHPCTNCRKSNVICVPVERPRLPRGRSGKTLYAKNGRDGYDSNTPTTATSSSSSSLQHRVLLLEQLVQSLLDNRGRVRSSNSPGLSLIAPPPREFANGPMPLTTTSTAGVSAGGVDADYGNFNNVLAGDSSSDFATQQFLVANFPSLKFGMAHPTAQPTTILNNSFFCIQPGDSNIPIPEGIPACGSAGEGADGWNRQVVQIFFDYVDPIFPMLHCSCLCDYFTEGKPYLDYNVDHPAPKALAFAVGYMAFSSISNPRCLQVFGIPRQVLLEKYHNSTQSALERVDYINTTDLTVLQAFVLFLLSIQGHDKTRKAWTMLSLALRIAQSQFLNEFDPPFPIKPVEREMRRRLWHTIALLDVQASFDRGSEPMLQSDCLVSQVFPATEYPDFLSLLQGDLQAQSQRRSFADPRFFVIMTEAQHAFRALNAPDQMIISNPDTFLRYRQHVAADFQQKSFALLADYQPEAFPFHWFIKNLVAVTHAFLELAAVRPVRSETRPSPNLVPQDSLLLLTVRFLQTLNQLRQDDRSEPFRWYLRLFVPWHPLSVAIDEVCNCEDVSLQVSCQSLIEHLLVAFQDMLSDTHRAMLQKPVGRFKALQQPGMNATLSVDFGFAADSSNMMRPDGSYNS